MYNNYKNIAKAIHIPYFSDDDINEAIRLFRRNNGSLYHTYLLRIKAILHRKIKRIDPKKINLLSDNKYAERLLAISAKNNEVLLVSHEMTLTGAPRALLTLGHTLKMLGYKPTILALQDGPLTIEAENTGIPVCITNSDILYPLISNIHTEKEKNIIQRVIDHFPCIIYNTIISVDILHNFINNNKSYIWIHEAALCYKYLRISHDEIVKALKKITNIWIVGELARKTFNTFTSNAFHTDNLLYGIPSLSPDSNSKKNDTTPTLSQNKINILFSGMMGQRKGTYLLLDAVKQLSEDEKSNIQIHIIGGSLEHKITRLLNAADSNVIKWWGMQSHDFVIAMMEKMQALICPSLDDPMPIVCTEAFQLGIPVATSDATGTAALITQDVDGMVFKADDVNALAETLRKLINLSPEKLKAIGHAGMNIYKENFTMEIFSRNLSRYFPAIPK